jgi:hypothetical protein
MLHMWRPQCKWRLLLRSRYNIHSQIHKLHLGFMEFWGLGERNRVQNTGRSQFTFSTPRFTRAQASVVEGPSGWAMWAGLHRFRGLGLRSRLLLRAGGSVSLVSVAGSDAAVVGLRCVTFSLYREPAWPQANAFGKRCRSSCWSSHVASASGWSCHWTHTWVRAPPPCLYKRISSTLTGSGGAVKETGSLVRTGIDGGTPRRSYETWMTGWIKLPSGSWSLYGVLLTRYKILKGPK